MSTRLPPEVLSNIFLAYVADVRSEYEQLVDYVRPTLKFYPAGNLPTTDPTNVLRAKALERWDARSSPWSWLRLLHVCHKWRDAALHCPHLWTWIVPEHAIHRISAARARRFDAFIEDCISRSGEVPLDIFYRHWPTGNRANSAQQSIVFRKIFAQFTRIRSASLNVTSLNMSHLQSHSSPINAPLLYKLELDLRGLRADTKLEGLTAAALPALAVVVLDGGTVELLAALLRPTLTSLTFRNPRRTVSHLRLLQLLDSVPSLRRLELLDVVDELPVNQHGGVPGTGPNPIMPTNSPIVSLPVAEEIHLTHTNQNGARLEKVGQTLLHLLKCLEFPSSTSILLDLPAHSGDFNLFSREFVADTVALKVCPDPEFAARAVCLDGESGHRYIKFWGSNQSAGALMTGTWTEPPRLSFGLWGMAHLEHIATKLLHWEMATTVTSALISMELDWMSWLRVGGELSNVEQLAVCGGSVSGALHGLVRRRAKHPDFGHDDVPDEFADPESFDDDDDDDNSNAKDATEEPDDDDLADGTAFEDWGASELFILPKLDTLVIRHMDANEVTRNGGHALDLLTYLVRALGRRRRLRLPIRVLRLVEMFHFSSTDLARLRDARVVDVIEWDGKVMDSKGYRLYDTEYVALDTYAGHFNAPAAFNALLDGMQ